MNHSLKLYMLLLGCTPKGRHIEQHDIFFGIAPSLKSLVPSIKNAWPEAKGVMHIDAWRMITKVEGYAVKIKDKPQTSAGKKELFFINLGGYLPGEFDERHYKLIVPAANIDAAKKAVKQNRFFTTHDQAHIDDKFALDIDDIFPVNDILVTGSSDCHIHLEEQNDGKEDEIKLGYFRLEKLDESW